MNRWKNIVLLAILAGIFGSVVAGCSGGAETKPDASDPALNEQPATTDGMAGEGPGGAKGGG